MTDTDFTTGDVDKLKAAIDSANKLENLGDLAGQSAFEIDWEELNLNRGRYVMTGRSAVVPTYGGLTKIVFHITRGSINDLEKIAEALALATQGLDITGTFAEAGQSPVIRGQWDFVLFQVPAVNAHNVHSYLRDAALRALT